MSTTTAGSRSGAARPEVAIVSQAHAHPGRVGSFRSRFLESTLRSRHGLEPVVLAGRQFRGGLTAWRWAATTVLQLRLRRWDVVYVTVPPGAAYLSALVGVPRGARLVVDARDSISHNIGTGYSNVPIDDGSARYRAARAIERAIYRRCHAFVVCTQGVFEHYARLFGDSERLRIAENGADVSVDRTFAPIPRGPGLRVVCVGRFWDYDPGRARMLLDVLERIAREGERTVTLRCVGHPDPRLASHVASRCPHVDLVQRGLVTYEEALEEVEGAAVGLFTLRNDDTEYGTKVYDYLAADRAALTVAGADSRLARRFGSVDGFFSIQPDGSDEDAVVASLLRWLAEASADRSPRAVQRRFSREVTMQPLVDAVLGR